MIKARSHSKRPSRGRSSGTLGTLVSLVRPAQASLLRHQGRKVIVKYMRLGVYHALANHCLGTSAPRETLPRRILQKGCSSLDSNAGPRDRSCRRCGVDWPLHDHNKIEVKRLPTHIFHPTWEATSKRSECPASLSLPLAEAQVVLSGPINSMQHGKGHEPQPPPSLVGGGGVWVKIGEALNGHQEHTPLLLSRCQRSSETTL